MGPEVRGEYRIINLILHQFFWFIVYYHNNRQELNISLPSVFRNLLSPVYPITRMVQSGHVHDPICLLYNPLVLIRDNDRRPTDY